MFVIERLLFTDCFGGKPHVDIISCELIAKHIGCISNNLKKKKKKSIGRETDNSTKSIYGKSIKTSNMYIVTKSYPSVCNV